MGYIRQKLSVALHRSVARSIIKRDIDALDVEDTNYVGRGTVGEEWRMTTPTAVAVVTAVSSSVLSAARDVTLVPTESGNLAARDKGKDKIMQDDVGITRPADKNGGGSAAPGVITNNAPVDKVAANATPVATNKSSKKRNREEISSASVAQGPTGTPFANVMDKTTVPNTKKQKMKLSLMKKPGQ